MEPSTGQPGKRAKQPTGLTPSKPNVFCRPEAISKQQEIHQSHGARRIGTGWDSLQPPKNHSEHFKRSLAEGRCRHLFRWVALPPPSIQEQDKTTLGSKASWLRRCQPAWVPPAPQRASQLGLCQAQQRCSAVAEEEERPLGPAGLTRLLDLKAVEHLLFLSFFLCDTKVGHVHDYFITFKGLLQGKWPHPRRVLSSKLTSPNVPFPANPRQANIEAVALRHLSFEG